MLRKLISLILCFSFLFTHSGFAQGVAELNLGQYLGQMGSGLKPDKFRPLHMRYFSYDIEADNFQLLLDKGDDKDIDVGNGRDRSLQEKTKVLMEYFQIGLTLPNDKFWVNLRPDAQDQIIDPELEKTDIGKIMLESDLQLKKDTAGFTSPQTPEGRQYWDRLYKKAGELFGTENITIPAITRPWIVPGEIIVREGEASAYIFKANLKVMLEEDYLANRKSQIANRLDYSFKDPRMKELNTYSTQLIRELIIPKLTKEVNTSKRYAALRQVFFSLVMARWFKERFKGLSPKGTVPFLKLIDSGDLTNLTSKQAWSKTTYFNEYKKSFEKGEYNLKENIATPYGQVIRSYVSGGELLVNPVATGRVSLAINKIPELPGNIPVNMVSSSVSDKDWDKVKQHFETLIDAATTQDELKRIYRKMAHLVHPDKVSKDDKEIAHQIFISLSDLIKIKLYSKFNVRRESTGAARSQTGQSDDWLESWSYTAWSNAGDAIGELKRREELVKSRGEKDIRLVAGLIANNIKKLSLRDLSDLLDITSKTEFANNLLKLTAPGAIIPAAMTTEVIWQARPMLEKIYVVRTLRKGELVHFRKGSLIIRTVILEPISKTNASLQMITPSESKYQMLSLTQEELIKPEFDLEREPLQTGYEMNIGEVFEVDLSDYGGFVRKMTTATIYGVAWGQYALVAHDVVHGNLTNMGGRGFGMGRSHAVNQLDAGKIRKITPSPLTLEQQSIEALEAPEGFPKEKSVVKTKIDLVQGDITRQLAEAVIAPVNSTMAVGLGVTGAIIRALGGGEQARNQAFPRGEYQLGSAEIASVGNLRSPAGWKYVIGAVIHHNGIMPELEDISKAIENALVAANRAGVTSVTLPAFGTGVIGLSYGISAIKMMAGVNVFLRKNPNSNIKQIKFVLFEQEAMTPFRNELVKVLGDYEIGSSSSAIVNNPGGIDFRTMNYMVQPIGSFKDLRFMLPALSLSVLQNIDLDQELAALRNMVKAGLVPSGARLKEYLAACFQKGRFEEQQDDILVCLAEIYRLQEEEVLETSPELRESLVIVDTGRFVLLPNNQKVGVN